MIMVAGEDPSDDQGEVEGSFEALPTMKIRKPEPLDVNEHVLTKYLAKEREFGPVYTGGAFHIIRGTERAIALNDGNLTLFDMQTQQKLA